MIPKILPNNQFNCQNDVNIVDKIREIRNINIDLLNEGSAEQKNGTILSIDFKNAF